ncbi:hypothetical protein F5Y13DRAFT_201849 [Hypoxylon sp. FL1857]|nr:hypothetical protein F5Y13DRAFT_201849 [Hypoxylon sp. FL1857]
MVAKLVSWLVIAATFATAENAGDHTLHPRTFSPLPVGSIKPTGWLFTHMQNMANGIAGNMYSDQKGSDGTPFYDYVRQSPWLDSNGTGATYSDLNEALPYWFNGLVPLAYSLDDEKLKTQVHEVARTVLDLQSKDGWIGPEKAEQYNWWARYPFLLGLTQLVEANGTWQGDVIPKLQNFATLIAKQLLDNNQTEKYLNCYPDHIEYDCTWSSVRLTDFMITMQWMLENHPSNASDDTLWYTLNTAHTSARWTWEGWYGNGFNEKAFRSPPNSESFVSPYLHGVNTGHLLKAPAVVRRFTHNDSLVQASLDTAKWIFENYGTPSGSIFGDAYLQDNKTYTGSELATAVEAGYSLAYLYQAFGDNYYADRAEMVNFNAIPSSLSSDYWSHRHIDQPNQPFATFDNTSSNIFSTTNNGMATIFGLEPISPSSTVNFPQGISKFLTHSWATVGTSGLIHALLGPSKVTARIGDEDVTVECSTNYPFGNVLTYNVVAGANFTLHLRVPSWNIQNLTSVRSNNTNHSIDYSADTETYNVDIPAGRAEVTYVIGMQPRFELRTDTFGSVYMGNVLYSLDLNMSTPTPQSARAYNDPERMLEASVPASFDLVSDNQYVGSQPWTIAIDPKTIKYDDRSNGTITDVDRFMYNSSTTFVTVDGCEISWGLYKNVTPDTPPTHPECLSPKKSYRLIPYGAAKIHMAELPIIKGTVE